MVKEMTWEGYIVASSSPIVAPKDTPKTWHGGMCRASYSQIVSETEFRLLWNWNREDQGAQSRMGDSAEYESPLPSHVKGMQRLHAQRAGK